MAIISNRCWLRKYNYLIEQFAKNLLYLDEPWLFIIRCQAQQGRDWSDEYHCRRKLMNRLNNLRFVKVVFYSQILSKTDTFNEINRFKNKGSWGNRWN
jgi:hypothetical protein